MKDDKFAIAVKFLDSLSVDASTNLDLMHKQADQKEEAPSIPGVTDGESSEQAPSIPGVTDIDPNQPPSIPGITEPDITLDVPIKQKKNKKPEISRNAPPPIVPPETNVPEQAATDTSKFIPENRAGDTVGEQLSEEQKERVLTMAREILGGMGGGKYRNGPTFMAASRPLADNIIREHGGGSPNKVLTRQDQDELIRRREIAEKHNKFKGTSNNSRKLFDDNFSTIYQLIREERGTKGVPALKELADQAMQYVKDTPATERLRQIQSLLLNNFTSATQHQDPDRFMDLMTELDSGAYDEYDDERLVVVPRNQDGKVYGYEKTLMSHIYAIYNILDIDPKIAKSEIPKLKKHYELILALFIQRVITKIVWIYYNAYKSYSREVAVAKESGESAEGIKVVPALVATPEDVLNIISNSREYATTIINYFRNAKNTDTTKQSIQEMMNEEVQNGVAQNELYTMWLELEPKVKAEAIMDVIASKNRILAKGSAEWKSLYYLYFDALKKYNNLFIRTKIANSDIVNQTDYKYFVPNMDSACMTDADRQSLKSILEKEEADTGYTQEDIKRIQYELAAARNTGISFGEPATDKPIDTNTVTVLLDPNSLDIMVVTVHIIDQVAYKRFEENPKFKNALIAEDKETVEAIGPTDFYWFGIFRLDKASGNITVPRKAADLENVIATALMLTAYEDLWPVTEKWPETAKEFLLQGEEVQYFGNQPLDDSQASFAAAMDIIKK